MSPAVAGVGHDADNRIPLVRTDHLLAAHGDFVMALRQSGLPFRRPPATGPLGRYPDRTSTGKSIAACQDTPHQPTRQRERALKRFRLAGSAQRFLSAFSGISPHFRPPVTDSPQSSTATR